MEVGETILAVGTGVRPASFDQFSAAIDPQWIADTLAATDTASVRRRKLPAEHVVSLVIGRRPAPGAPSLASQTGTNPRCIASARSRARCASVEIRPARLTTRLRS